MSLLITGIPDCRAVLGPSQDLRAYQLQPGTSDYVTGGYPILASQVALSILYGAWIIAKNGTLFTFATEFDFASGAFGTTPTPQTTIYLKVNEIVSSGSIYEFQEVPAGTDLSGTTWWAEFLGY